MPNETITIELNHTGSTGLVNVTINGVDYEIEDNKVIISNLTVGDYTIIVNLAEDENYTQTTNSTTFKVVSAKSNITIDVNELYLVGDDIVINVTAVNSTGTINVTINGKEYTIVNDKITIGGGLEAGEYIINAVLSGDENYTGSTATKTFKIEKYNVTITLDEITASYVGDEITFTATLNETVTGDVVFNINGINYTVSITDANIATYKFTPANNTSLNVATTFTGNNKFNSNSSNEITVTVNKVPVKVNVSLVSDSIFVGKNTTLNIELNQTISTTVTVRVNDKNHTVSIVDGKGNLTLSNLANGTYTINATFTGDSKYLVNTSNTVTLEVNKIATDITVSVATLITYGDDVIVSVRLNESINATVQLSVDDANYNVALVDGTGSFNATGLSSGSHRANVTFAGDDKYITSTNTTTFNIANATLNANVIANNVSVSENTSFIIDITDKFNGNVSITVDGEILYNGSVKTFIEAGRLSPGDKTATVVFYGDDNYNELTIPDVEFSVSRVTPEINVTIEDVVYPNKAVANINISNKANGTIKVVIGDDEFTGTVENGIANVNLTGLSAGSKTATVEFTTTDEYNSNINASAKFNVVKANSTINITVNEIYVYNETITIELNHTGSTGLVNVTINGKEYAVSENRVVIENLTVGDYTIIANLAEDENYTQATNATTFKVIPAKSNITIEVSEIYLVGDDIVINVTAVNSTGTINVTINGKVYTVTENKINISGGLEAGEYIINAVLVGNENYTGSNATKIFNVEKHNITVTLVDVNDVYVGDEITFTANLNETVNGDVVFNINGINYTVSIIDTNIATYKFTPANNTSLNVVTTFIGNNKFNSNSSEVITVDINKVPIKVNVTLDKNSIFVGENTTLSIELNQTINTTVTVNVNGEKRTVSIVDGKADLTLSNLANDTYNINATFDGDSKYLTNTSNTVTLEINKIETNITVNVTDSLIYGSDVIVSIKLNASINTTVKLVIDENSYDIALINGIGSFNATGLSSGLHKANVTFAGDDKYLTSSNSTTFNIANATLNANVIANNVSVSENTSFVIDITDKFNGNVSITVDGEVLYNGTVKTFIEAGRLTSGDKTATVVFYGDDNYNELTIPDVEFSVSRVTSEINVTIEDVVYPNKAVADINISNKANGTIKVVIGENEFTGTVENGIANVNLTGLSAGSKIATVEFTTTDDYNSNVTAIAKFNVVKTNSTINITVNEIYTYNETITIELNHTGSTGLVNVTINGKKYAVSENRVVIENLTVGDYTIIANLAEDENYTQVTNSTTFKVIPAKSNITIEVSEIYLVGDDIVINITSVNSTGTINITINGKVYTVTENKINISGGLEAGEYIINAVLVGNENYTGSNATKIFNVEKHNITVTLVDVSDVYVGDEITFTANLNETVSGDVVFNINGINYTVSVTNNNIATYTFTPVNTTSLNVVATFTGNNKFNSNSSEVITVDINKVPIKVNVSLDKTSIIVGENATLNIELNQTINTTVTVEVNGENHTVNIIDGKGSLVLSNLANGTYNINATFNGDNKYLVNTSNTVTLSVNKIATDITVSVATSITYGSDVIVSVRLNESINATVQLSVDDANYNIALIDGAGSFNATGLSSGSHKANVTFAGDDKYLTSSNSTTFNIANATLNANVIANNVSVNENTSFIIDITDKFNGNVSISVDGEVLYNGSVKTFIEAGRLAPGDKTATVVFYGDNNYTELTLDNVAFSVSRVTPEINVTIDDVVYPNNAVAVVTIGNNANGTVNITIGENEFIETVENGIANVDLTGLSAGSKTATVKFITNDSYNSNVTAITKFTVNKNNSTVTISVEEEYIYNNTITIGLTVVGSDGRINVTINGKEYTVSENKVVIDNLTVGDYTIIANLAENENYTQATNSTTFKVIPAKSNITIEVSEIYLVGDDIVINVTAVNSTGTINVTINGKVYPLDNNKVIITNGLEAGEYIINAVLSGDENYTGSTATKTFEVEKYNITVTLDDITTGYVGSEITFTANLNETVSGDVIFNINGINYTVSVTNINIATYTFTPTNNTSLNVVATFTGNNKYNSNSSNVITVTVNKVPIKVNVSLVSDSIFVGENTTLNIELNQTINTTVTVKVNDKNHTANIIDGKGNLTLNSLASDTYTINATFSGDVKYLDNTSESVSLEVNKIDDYSVNVTVHDIKFGENETIVIILPADVDNDKLVIKVDGEEKSHTMINGVVNVIVPNLSVGTHEVNVTYTGDDKYTSKDNNSNMFTVMPSSTYNIIIDVDNRTFGEDTLFTVTLPVGVTENVTIKIDNNSYSAKPDAGGVATLTLNNISGGLHTVTAIYPGDDYYIANSNATSFMISRAVSTIDVNFTTPVFVGDDVLVNISMGQKINATVTLAAGSHNYTVIITDGNGSYIISDLANGTYDIKAVFDGNENYTQSTSQTKELKVNKVPIKVDISLNDNLIYVGENTTLNIELNQTINTTVTVNVNDEDYIVGIVDGKGNLTLSNLASDTYTINATFSGDAKYLDNTSNNAYLEVSKISDYSINVTVHDINFGDNETIVIILPSDVNNNNLIIKVDGEERSHTMINGVVNLIVSGLHIGTHEVNVTYIGDYKYNSKDNNSNIFTVSPTTTYSMHLDVLNRSYGENTIFKVTLPQDATNNVTLSIDGEIYSVKLDSQGLASLTLNNLSGGLHEVTAIYPGDEEYSRTSISKTFMISRAASTIDVNFTTPVFVGDDVLVNISMGQKINTTVTLTVGSHNYTVSVTDGNGSYTVSDLANGTYDIKAIFGGNENYTQSTSQTKELEVNKVPIKVDISLDKSSIFVGENATLSIELNQTINTTVTVNVNGEKRTVTIVGGKADLTLSNLANGTYVINATFDGDSKYLANTSNTVTLEVNKIETNITVNVTDSLIYGSDVIVSIKLNASINTTVKLVIDEDSYDVALIDGTGSFNASRLSSGLHKANVTFAGDDKYISSNSSTTFNIENATLNANVIANNISVNENTSFIIDITDNFNGNVSISIGDNVLYNGSVKTLIEANRLAPGDKTATVVFYGDDNYDELIIPNVEFSVSRVTPDIDVTIDDISYPDNAVAKITVDNNANGTVNITVDGNVYNGTVKDGVANVDLTGLSAGTKTATVEFFSDDDYNDNTSTATKFNVNKANSTVKIDVNSEYSYNQTIIIELNITGSNSSVSVTVNGKNYNVSENKVIIDDIAAGEYTVIASVDANENYTQASNSTTFKVTPAKSNITIDVNDVYLVGDDIVINITSVNATDKINVTINGKEYAVTDNKINITGGLEAGEYIIRAVLSGNENYTGSDATKTFSVEKHNITVTLNNVSTVYVGDEITFTANLNESASGEILFNINGINYTVSINNTSNASYTFTPANNASLEVTARFIENNKYHAGSSDAVTVEVDKIPVNVTVSLDKTSITAGENATLSIELNQTINTTVTVNVNDEKYAVVIVDGKANLTLNNLANGTYTINATFDGDVKYLSNTSNTLALTVNAKVIPDISIDVNADNKTVKVGLPDNATGNLTVKVDGIVYNTTNITENPTLIDIGNLTPGNHSIEVIYSGDDSYDAGSNSTMISIAKISDYEISVIARDINYGCSTDITVTLPDTINDVVLIDINGIGYYANVSNGVAELNLPLSLKPGTYNVTATFNGDETYALKSANDSFEVNPITPEINVELKDNQIIVEVPEDAEGNVTIAIDGKNYTVPVKDGKAVLDISELKSGSYPVNITYSGDEKYASKTVNTTVNRTRDLIITAPDVVKYYSGDEKFVVYTKDSDGNNVDGLTILITVNNVTYTRTTSNGEASMALNVIPNNYTIGVVFKGNEEFEPQILEANVEVLHTIYADDVFKAFRNDTQYWGLFLDGNGTPLANTNVSFNIHGVFYTRTTNASGWVKLNINLDAGEYILTAFNPVTGERKSNNITVFTLIESADMVKYFKNESQFVIRVRGDDGNWAKAGEKVVFNINGVFYTRYTNETGHITLNINLNPGEYIVTICYRDCRKSNLISVLPRLVTSNLTMKYGDGSSFVVKTLDKQGNFASSQLVSFNINGRIYYRITDSQGEAKVQINLQPDVYIITSQYGQESEGNIIRIEA